MAPHKEEYDDDDDDDDGTQELTSQLQSTSVSASASASDSATPSSSKRVCTRLSTRLEERRSSGNIVIDNIVIKKEEEEVEEKEVEVEDVKVVITLREPQTHLILFQQDTFDQALFEYTRYLFFAEANHGHESLTRPLHELSHQIFLPQRLEDILSLVEEYPNITRLTLLHVDLLPLDSLIALLSAYSSSLQKLELFASPQAAGRLLDSRLLVQLYRMRLTHYALPFDPEIVIPDGSLLPPFPLHVDLLSLSSTQSWAHRRLREFFGASALYRPAAERAADPLVDAEFYSIKHREMRYLRQGRLLETSLLGSVLQYGKVEQVKGRTKAADIAAASSSYRTAVNHLGVTLNSLLDIRHFRANSLPSLFNWSALTALDLDLPPHIPLAHFLLLIGGAPGDTLKSNPLPNLTALRLSERPCPRGPRTGGALFANFTRADLANGGATIMTKLGGAQLLKLRSLTLAHFAFGNQRTLVRGERRFEQQDTNAYAGKKCQDLGVAYDLSPLNSKTILEIVLPALAPNVTSLHFEDCILDFGGIGYSTDYLFRVLACNWTALRRVARNNVLMFTFGEGETLYNLPERQYRERWLRTRAQMLRNGWWARRRTDLSRLQAIAALEAEVVELPVELWTEAEKEDRARGPAHNRGLFVTKVEAHRRAVQRWGRRGRVAKPPIYGGESVLYERQPSTEQEGEMEEKEEEEKEEEEVAEQMEVEAAAAAAAIPGPSTSSAEAAEAEPEPADAAAAPELPNSMEVQVEVSNREGGEEEVPASAPASPSPAVPDAEPDDPTAAAAPVPAPITIRLPSHRNSNEGDLPLRKRWQLRNQAASR